MDIEDQGKRIKKYTTDKKNRENDLVKIILDTLDQPTSLLDKSYCYLYVNKAYEKYLGKSRDEIIGNTLENILGEENFKSVVKYNFDLCISGESVSFPNTFQDKAGNTISMYSCYEPYRNSDGEITGVVSTSVDIKKIGHFDSHSHEIQKLSRLFLDSRNDLMFFKDKNLVYKISNKANSEFLGKHSEQEVLGKTDNDLLPEEVAKKFNESDRKAIETGRPVISKEKVNDHLYETRRIPVMENNTCLGIAGVVEDITRKRRGQLKLEESEEKYRSLVNNALEGIFIVQDGKIVFSNPLVEKISGFSRPELKDKLFVDMIYREDQKLILMNNTKRLKGEDIAPYDFRIIKKSGVPLWVRLNAATISWENKPAVLCFMSDIHKRKNAEFSLRESEEKFRRLSESTPTGILMYQNNRWVYANSRAAEITQYTIQELYEMNFWEIVHLEDRKKVIENGLKRQRAGNFTSTYHFRIITKNGNTKWVSISGASTLYKGEPAGIVSIVDITEQKTNEQMLLISEANFKFLADVTFESIVVHKNGIIVDVNKSFETLTGYTREEAIGKNLLTALAFHKDTKMVLKKIKKASVKPYQVRAQKKNGEVFWCELEGQDSTKDGEEIRIVAIRDITKRMQMEKKLRESEERFRMIFENAPIMIDSFEKDGSCVLWNKECEKRLGWKKSELSSSFDMLKHCYPDPKVYKKVTDDIVKGDGVFREYEIVTKLGNKRYQLWANFLLPAGTPISVGYDITDRVLAEKALKESLREIESMTANNPLVIWKAEIDSQGKLINSYISEGIDQLAGVKKGTIHNDIWSCLDFVKEEYKEGIHKELKKAISNTGKTFNVRYEIIRGDKKESWMQSSFKCIREEDSCKIYGSHMDVTDMIHSKEVLRESEQKQKELNAEKDKFFSIIAHDLKSPFNAILGFSQILMDQIGKVDCKTMKQYAQQMYTSSKQGYELLINLLQWARNQSGNMIFTPKRLNLDESIKNVLEQLSLQAGEKDIKLDYTAQKCECRADSDMLNTVLRNLISNSIKYSQMGKTVFIEAKEINSEIHISVRDKGIGIKKKDREKLFHLDSGFSTVGTNKELGTGLGLIICSDLVKRHGGVISVESEVGKGSTFTVILPK